MSPENSTGPGPEPEPSSAAYFKSIPWCAAHLTPSTESITYYHPPWTRDLDPGSGTASPASEGQQPRITVSDQFFSSTLNTAETVPRSLWFYPTPGSPSALVPTLRALVRLEAGVGGYPRFAHGGAVATLLDEITGLLCTLNRQRGALDRRPAMTGFLNTRFLRPVPAPGIVLAGAEVVRTAERKTWVRGWIEGEGGEVLCEAEALFVNLKGRL
ncbi:hypothetical protein JX265_001597 [Neoarthrinium moseri]|uniref:Thioesterase domain-containing protein n=1 Tax=Neoarthrinium moseri TaxID=1658444 RepID=A0A9Q0AV87_9PEZI|nr:uncharacterized protein JN550_003992 [Neoarthrinium moseri]KAI1844611.1 hypothetical protein JX266_009284 [Neoarthrinium moseri]KAI1872273.1 hypothetical protein JN550_003992 [Neoarthrinium moseri]KAI1879976.1 hypothetical protein JX265_001597 [Neoarthrinium moseri]